MGPQRSASRIPPDKPTQGHGRELVSQADPQERNAGGNAFPNQRLGGCEPGVFVVIIGAHISAENDQAGVNLRV